jgi:LAS superfamily LD-carboxypeptidase LdcB
MAEAAAQARIDSLEQRVRDLAVDAFIHPPSDDAYTMMESDSLNDASQRKALLDLRADSDADVLDQLSAARQDRAVQRKSAERAAQRAADKEAEAAGRLDKVRAARSKQAAFASQVQSRLDSALAARVARSGGSGGGGGGAVRSGNINLANAHGPSGCSITVNERIVDNLQRLLDAAGGDGVSMCGGGYRSSDQQVALRRAHCGSSNYDIYEKPSSECHPPTAPPGTSMHEQGLAVDFTYDGSVISSHDSPAYRWLDAHASSYGFYNLPSEPWHWSVNGN